MKETIMKISNRFLAILLMAVLIITGGSLPAAAQSSFRFTSLDEIKYPPLRFNLPPVQRVVLKNGIILYILENHELPLVNISAKIKTGTMYDPEGKEGVAELTAYVMRTGGTAQLNSSEIDKQFDFMASSASISMSTEAAQVNFSSLNNNLDHGLELLSQIIIHPAFEQEKFELARRLKNEDLRRLKDDPHKLAFREFSRIIYRDDPRGRFPSYKSLANIERDDLIKFHSRFFMPDNIIFAVSGDVTKDEVINKFNLYFGDWKAKNTFAAVPPPAPKSNAGVYFINKEISQSTIVSGQFTIGKTDPDFYAFTVLDFITGGGGFPSRIMSVVRNNEGLAYSAGCFYNARPEYGVFATYAFTKTSSTLKTLSLIDSVLENIQAGTITTKELDWAKNSINNGFIFSFSSPEQIASQQMNLEYENLPSDFLINFRNKIENVAIKDLNKAAVKYLDKSKNVVLILGDGKKFGEPMTSIGPYISITPEE
jgi:predicted Zn-dependent peptidase